MTRTRGSSWCGRAVWRLAVVAAGFALMWTLGVQDARAQLPPGISSTLLARGPFTDLINFKMQAHVGRKVDTVQVHGAADMVVAQITIAPGAAITWHSHPGPAVVVVVTGTLTIYDGDDPTCTGRSYTGEPSGPLLPPIGEAFVDLGQGHVHDARNEGNTPVTVLVTYFDVPTGEAPLILASGYVSACPSD
jgi:mannose-6-phosphate isomerase-like protein (cupin superfamily)